MTITLKTVRDLALHGLGLEPDPRHNIVADINRAARAICTEDDWWWMQRGPVNVTLVNGQIEVPPDYLELRSLTSPTGIVLMPRPTTVAEIMLMRQARVTVTTPAFYYATNLSIPQAGQAPRQTIITAPVSGDPQTLAMTYKASWSEIPLNADDNWALAMPDECEGAIVYRTRVESGLLENQTVNAELENYRAEIEKLKRIQAGRQMNHGQMKGGASRFFGATNMGSGGGLNPFYQTTFNGQS